MAYSDFKLNDVQEKLQLAINGDTALFRSAPVIAPSAWLDETLQQTLPLALKIGTEKARSELIITPLLVEFHKIAPQPISLFSGTLFNVEPALGLTGFCDFIISRTSQQLLISAPVLMVVEAKNEDINAGVPQCLAAMFAAHIFNLKAQQPATPIYGVVTTGTNWRFLKLEGKTAFVDRDEYYVSQVDKLLGIFISIMEDTAPALTQKAA